MNSKLSAEDEVEGEVLFLPQCPKPVDIDDGIQRDIKITQEIFGVITQYGNDFEVMRFTLKNTLPNGIKVQVMSLGAALVGVIAPDRKGVYKDVVLGFDSVNIYYSPLNPGFGRVTSLCPLPYNLEKVVWDWDFDRDEGSVTFSTNFYRIDLILSVKYSLNVCNEIIVDLQACGSKIVPISLTSQVYWNMAGHSKGEKELRKHVLSINSDTIWKHYNHKLKNFYPIHETVLDFRQPTFMDNPEIFGSKKFEHVFVLTKGCEERVGFAVRLIHPRTCRYVEIFTDQPWILCNTKDWDLKVCDDEEDDFDYGECSEDESDIDPCATEQVDEFQDELDEIPGKGKALYRKFGSFCVTPLSDLSGYDPILRAGKHYSHRIIYKVNMPEVRLTT
ncbi:aldose-1-epimerase, putative [Pediculus humanus corporis]|uniref:Galactose mutarotase n=1 Tax=Pediculus humanus subsp. corporis TaxID=121224 RepID=E0VTZ7_PEDHC|nr:aldose-1-epimerase, putative [Pediculus humanus corporis]EEB16853.1 aldose-1-epimerase, putative [Pediculus humanus corporis]